mgnify:FL=1
MREDKYEYWLCQTKYLRLQSMRRLRETFVHAKAVYEAPIRLLERCSFLTEKEKKILLEGKKDGGWEKRWEEMGERGIRVFTYFHDGYPKRLRHIYQPPKCLYVKGNLPEETKISMAIVGARDCSVYGRDMARMFGFRLAEQGIQVISGMAKGVDGWSHQGALEAGGGTFAVLGTGVDVCYPSSHQALYRSIARHGGVISELPVSTKAMPPYFPQRNRIISGLSQGVLIVEARERSGSLITADAALEQGRDVFVIPGRIGDELSEGCNRLIRQGAVLVLSPQDILQYYKLDSAAEQPREAKSDDLLLACMQINPMHIDSIIAETKLSPTEAMKGLIRLCRNRKIEEVGRGYYQKKL